MLTIILSIILFSFGGWFSEYSNCFSRSGYIPSGTDYATSIFAGCFLGFLIGFALSLYLSKFVARKYPIDEKFPLLPFSDGETYLVNNDGDINYCREEGNVRTANKYEVAYIKVNDREDFPYVAYCYPERGSFWGLFATFILSANDIFIVLKETMIKKGRVEITKTTNYKLILNN